MTLARSFAAAVGTALLLGGCTVEVPFDVSWSLQVRAPPGVSAVAVPVDLAEHEDMWRRRDSVESVSVESLRLGVLEVRSANVAESVEVVVRCREGGAPASGEEDLGLLEGAVLRLQPDASVEVATPGGLDQVFLRALRGSGRFTLVVQSTAGEPMEATLAFGFTGSATVTP